MTKLTQEARLKRWFARIAAADTVYTEWAERFHVDRLEHYYERFQWAGKNLTAAEANQCYVINLTFASVRTQKPGLLFQRPKVKVERRPNYGDDRAAPQAAADARLWQAAVQRFVDRPEVRFLPETSLGLHDAHTRFAVVEVGSAINEGLYVKRIPAQDFRVSSSDRNRLDANDWVGYREWHDIEDVKRNDSYRNTSDLQPSTQVHELDRDQTPGSEEPQHLQRRVCLWKIWDLRTHTRLVLAEGHGKFLLDEKPFTHFPFADLKFYERLGHYYPLPVLFNWLGRQDEAKAGAQVSDWLARVSRLILLTLREQTSLSWRVALQTKATARRRPGIQRPIAQTATSSSRASNLGALDLDVCVDLESLVPVAQQERVAWSHVHALPLAPRGRRSEA